MLIPIGHEQTEVRRVPWLTVALIAACLLSFLYARHQQGAIEPALVEARAELFAYFSARPYLTLDSRVERILFEGADAERRMDVIQAMRDAHHEFVFDFQIREEQSRLDELSVGLLAQFESHPFQRWGLTAGRQTPVGWLTHLFMHGGWLHLIGNMLLLFLMGFCIEELWGRPLFSALYLGAGVASAGLFVLMYPELDIPLIGASGAVAGLMGAFLVRCWSVRIKLFYWFLFLTGTFSAPAWLVLPAWFSNELLSAWVMDRVMPGTGGGGVAHWAHVGGFLFGAAAALGIRLLRIEERYLAPKLESKFQVTSNPAVERAGELRAEERHEEAFELLTREVRENARNYDAGVAFWDVASYLDRADEAVLALGRLIRHDLQRGELDLALRHVRELTQRAPEAPGDFSVLMRLGSTLVGADRARDASLVFRAALHDAAPPLPGPAALRVVRTVLGFDVEVAVRAARSGLAAADLDEPIRAELEAIVAEHEELEKPDPDPEAQDLDLSGPVFDPDASSDDSATSATSATGGAIEALELDRDAEDAPLELDTDYAFERPSRDDIVAPLELDPDPDD
jgi:membrane associated rhomboid family serine protease